MATQRSRRRFASVSGAAAAFPTIVSAPTLAVSTTSTWATQLWSAGILRFQYGGFWFGFVDPWPVGWYYTDDFYIDYVDGGYYMYNPYYPGARFAITVVI